MDFIQNTRQQRRSTAFDLIKKHGKLLLPVIFMVIITLVVSGCRPAKKWAPERGGTRGGYPGENWQMASSPEQVGWSSQKLAAARSYSKKIGSAAVMIVEDGIVVDAWGEVTRNFKCHSMRKSLMSALIGIHVAEGRMDLAKTVGELGIDDYPPSLTPQEKQATVGDLIKARSGIYHPALGEAPSMKALRPKRHSHAPGTFWYYNNWDFNALGTIFEHESGTGIFKEFETRFANPLQMEDFKISNCRYRTDVDEGVEFLSRHRYYFFRMSARDLARFGLLFLRQGKWQHQQILTPEWVKESTASYSKRGVGGGYGYMWWTGAGKGLFQNAVVKEHSYYASGYGGHKVIVLPYRNLVVVHRVNTDGPARHVQPHQIGRLLWHILDAAGEKDIGEKPMREAAKGSLLDTKGLNRLLSEESVWTGDNTGIFPGGTPLVISLSKAGKMTLKPGSDPAFFGTWRIADDLFYYNILGFWGSFSVAKHHEDLRLYDHTGTLFGKFKIIGK